MARVFVTLALATSLMAGSAHAMIALEPIREVVRGSYDALYQCVAGEPPGTYAVSVRMRIEPDGSVSDVVPTRSDLAVAGPALDCVLRTLLTLRFPPLRRDDHVIIHYPFRFVR